MISEGFRNLIGNHAPTGWESGFSREQVRGLLGGEPLACVVLSLDIRMSTALMYEAKDLRAYAQVLAEFVSFVRGQLQESGGWFEKFTGDGLIGFWPHVGDREAPTMIDAVLRARFAMMVFRDVAMPQLRRNSQSFPSDVGLSAGLDLGLASLVEIGGHLNLVGKPVVGAVRMVNAAAAWEILANTSIGAFLHECPAKRLQEVGLSFERVVRPSKEYGSGQEVYSARLQTVVGAKRLVRKSEFPPSEAMPNNKSGDES